MLIVGHTALAYLMVRPLLSLDRSRVKPKNVFLIFIFANIIDVINFSFFRYFAHTLIGIFIFTGFWLIIFNKYNIIEKRIIPLFLLATCSHIIGDYLFGIIYFFGPIINTSYSVYGYDHLIGHFAETIIFMIFFIIFMITQDFQKMNDFIHYEKEKFVKSYKLKNIFNSDLYFYYLFIVFYLFSITQFIHFITDHLGLMKYNLVVWAFLFCFILFLALFTFIGFIEIRNNDQQKTDAK